MDVDTTRLDTYTDALHVSKLKTLTDIESFLLKNDVSQREKLETLYITYAFYNDLMNYIEGRCSDLNS